MSAYRFVVPDQGDLSAQNQDKTGSSVSVCIVCRNEADRIIPCLESVQWANEILVLDLASTDGSAALAKQYGAKVFERDPVPIVEMVRNEIASYARGEWILVLDPDERVTHGLARELRNAAVRTNIDAVVIPRMNFDLGYPPTNPLHRYEPQLRMYRRSKVKWPVIPNALPCVPEERLHRLPQDDEVVLIHDRSRNIAEVLGRIIRYAPAQAQSMIDQGQQFTVKAMISTLAEKAYKQFLTGEPWRDGVPGLLRASLLVSFHFYVWAAFWQLSGCGRTVADDRFVRRLGLVARATQPVWRVCRALSRLTKRFFRN